MAQVPTPPAGDLSTVLAAQAVTQADLDTAESDIDDLETNATSAQACAEIPITSWRLATGAAMPAYSDGVDGLTLQDSEAVGIRFNNGVHTSMMASVGLPNDLDETADVVIHALGFRIGSADDDAALTFGAFFQVVGSAHTADADAGGDTTAFDQATTIVSEETCTIGAADVPAAPSSLSLTMVSKSTLDADDMVVTRIWIEYTRKQLAS